MLNHDDIQDILSLLDATGYRQLKLETDRFTLTLQREGSGWTTEQVVTTQPKIVANDVPPGQSTESSVDTDDAATDHLHRVCAPLPGTFYRSPKPGAAPFVDIGSRVEVDTQVCIIETMKLMNAVYAGIRGTVVEITRQDGEFADKDAVILRIEPETSVT